jgi:cell division protein FtsB
MPKGKDNKHDKQRSRSVTYTQFLAIILITIALTVTLDFGRRAAVSADLQREAEQLEAQVATLQAENRTLVAQREWVQTDGFVEEWARTEGVMVLYGETPVAPVLAGQAVPAAEVTLAPSPESSQATSEGPEETSHWQEWWALFFGGIEEPVQPTEAE